MSRIFPCNNVTGSLNLNPFTCNTIQDLFSVNRFHPQFEPLPDPLLNMWGTMRSKINFIRLCLTPKWIASFKKTCYEFLSSKSWGEPKTVIFWPSNAYTIN